VEKAPVAITIQCGGSFCYCNPAAVRFFGAASESELIGRTILDFVHPDSRAQVWERIATALETGQPTIAEVDQFVRLDGGEVTAEVVGIPATFKGKPALQEIYREIAVQNQEYIAPGAI
jgi:PAS domain S-box-containing protein